MFNRIIPSVFKITPKLSNLRLNVSTRCSISCFFFCFFFKDITNGRLSLKYVCFFYLTHFSLAVCVCVCARYARSVPLCSEGCKCNLRHMLLRLMFFRLMSVAISISPAKTQECSLEPGLVHSQSHTHACMQTVG